MLSKAKEAAGSALPELHWTIHDFVILAEIHSSTSGSVLKARRKQDRKTYALKRKHAAELGASHDILHEAKLLCKLAHPNIIHCYGYFRGGAGHEVYIVLEWASYGDIQHFIRRNSRPGKGIDPQTAMMLGHQVATALSHLHAHRVIHRDVKGLNVVLADASETGKSSLSRPHCP